MNICCPRLCEAPCRGSQLTVTMHALTMQVVPGPHALWLYTEMSIVNVLFYAWCTFLFLGGGKTLTIVTA